MHLKDIDACTIQKLLRKDFPKDERLRCAVNFCQVEATRVGWTGNLSQGTGDDGAGPNKSGDAQRTTERLRLEANRCTRCSVASKMFSQLPIFWRYLK